MINTILIIILVIICIIIAPFITIGVLCIMSDFANYNQEMNIVGTIFIILGLIHMMKKLVQ